MTGKQIKIYVWENDEIVLEGIFFEDKDSCFFCDRSVLNGPSILPGITEAKSFIVYATKKKFLPKIKFYRIGNTEYYGCDPYISPVVEVFRCSMIENSILPGRLYFNNKHYNADGEDEYKDEEFIYWANDVFKRARRDLIALGGGKYAGARAIELSKNGFTLRSNR